MKRIISILLATLMMFTLMTGCGKRAAGENDDSLCGDLCIGDIKKDGFKLDVEAGTFVKDSKITVQPADAELDKRIISDEKYEIVGSPVTIESDTYDGSFFTTDVVLTMPIDLENDEDDIGRFAFVYYDENTEETRYLIPDHYNSEEGTMEVLLPHFSPYAGVSLKESEQIDLYLQKYSTDRAKQEADFKEAEAAIGPYVKAKLEAAKLSDDALKDLTVSVIRAVGGNTVAKLAGEDRANNAKSLFSTLTDVGKAAYEDDASAAQDAINNVIASQCADYLNNTIFGTEEKRSESSQKKADRVGFVIGNINAGAKIAGYLEGGDMKSAAKEVASLMEGYDSKVEVGTKMVGYVGAKINEGLIDLKANGIDELYNIYKNGKKSDYFFQNNAVEALNEEEFRDYLNYGSLTKANVIRKYYNLDKIGEILGEYGLNTDDYNKVPDSVRVQIDKRIEDTLINYFKSRLAQEKAAEQIKKDEQEIIESMLSSYGALNSRNYQEFFGESSKDDFNINDRLDRLMQVRTYISQFVNEDELAQSQKAGAFNYGDLLNEWLELYTNNPKSEAIELFLEGLEEKGLLNEAYAPDMSKEDVPGKYTGSMKLLELHVSDEAYAQFKSQNGDDMVDVPINSKADCDALLEQMIESGEISLTVSPSAALSMNTGTGAATLTIQMVNQDGDESACTASGYYSTGKIGFESDGGESEATLSVKDGVISMKSDGVIFEIEEEGIVVLYAKVSMDLAKSIK